MREELFQVIFEDYLVEEVVSKVYSLVERSLMRLRSVHWMASLGQAVSMRLWSGFQVVLEV